MMGRHLAALLALAAPEAAAQEALYGAQPPPGAAFVRFVNAAGGEVAVHPDFLPPLRLGVSGVERVGAYAVVDRVAARPLAVSVQQGARTAHASLSVVPGSYLTVLVMPAPGDAVAAVPVVDAAGYNQARARLVFYNAAADCPGGGLALTPSGPAVFADVAPGTAKSRSVSPVKASLRATCAASAALGLAPGLEPGSGPDPGPDPGPDSGIAVELDGMEAGGSYSIWLMQPGGVPMAFVTRDKTLPYQP